MRTWGGLLGGDGGGGGGSNLRLLNPSRGAAVAPHPAVIHLLKIYSHILLFNKQDDWCRLP